MITCRVLGPIEVLVDDAPAPPELLWRKHLALLMYLARSPKRARTREHLCGLLWPEKDESAARHSLNEALRVLRRSGLGEALDASAGQVHLSGEAVQLDADALEQRIADAAWADAAAVITGEFLEGFAVAGAPGFEDWLVAERRHWTGRSIAALLGLSDDLLRRGHAAESLAAATRAETLDPASNAAARGIMAALAGDGNPAAALRYAERFAEKLGELGTEPEEETRRLMDRIRRGRIRARRAAPPAAKGDRRRAPLVGRSEELGALLRVWEQCRGGTAGVMILEGEAGNGKTRLLDELATRAELSGGTAVLVRAVEGDLAGEDTGVLGLARGGLLSAPGLPAAPAEALGAFAAAVPEWAERFSPSDGRTVLSLGRALPLVVGAALGEGPLLLVVDDAQWIDRPSLLAIVALLRDYSRAPLAVALAVLPQPPREELDEVRRRIGTDLPGLVLALRPLGGEPIRQLAAWALPSYDAVALERVSRRVTSDSAGIPFLAVELLSAVAQGLDLKQGAAAWPSPTRTLTQTLPSDLPDTVVAAIRVGFRRLSGDAQQVLAAAAVLGSRTTPAMLARASGLPPDRVDAALDELEWQRWLEMDGLGYGFVARVAGQVVAGDMITPGQLARIRERCGTGT